MEWYGQEGSLHQMKAALAGALAVFYSPSPCHSFARCIKTMLLTEHVSLVLSLHLVLIWALVATSMCCCQQPHSLMLSRCIPVPIQYLKARRKVWGSQPTTCFVLSWTGRVPINNHMQADTWEYNWLSMKKKNIYLSIASIYRPLCKSGPI